MLKLPALTHLGTFEVEEGTLIVSDPCYNLGLWCQGEIQNTKLGTWNAYARHGKSHFGDNRVWELVIIHQNYPESLTSKMTEDTDIDVGVDSGQAGFFDKNTFHGGEDSWGEDGWYDLCCRTTLDTTKSAGVINGGCVSSSGYGDGGYSCFVTRDGTSEVIGAKIIFISKDDEEED